MAAEDKSIIHPKKQLLKDDAWVKIIQEILLKEILEDQVNHLVQTYDESSEGPELFRSSADFQLNYFEDFFMGCDKKER